MPSIDVEFEGPEGDLCQKDKYGLGAYEYIGNISISGKAVYIRSEQDMAGGWSVILFDEEGGKKWIATVIVLIHYLPTKKFSFIFIIQE